MSEEIPIHYVCTHSQARELIARQERFWVSNCGCREANAQGCQRSRMDLCLFWAESDEGSGTNRHPTTRAEVDAILEEAEVKRLVTRPFRNNARTETVGICFCCDDCCGYFVAKDDQGNAQYPCDKGELIEATELADCTHSGECAAVCYSQARTMQGDRLILNRDKCFGCGLCAGVCPAACIQMVRRS